MNELRERMFVHRSLREGNASVWGGGGVNAVYDG
jgi:hypothetical protein